MTDSNRLRIGLVRETTLGTTPASPKMRTGRVTGEGLRYTPTFTQSDEIRSDRMSADPTKVNETNGGPINFELFYPASRSFSSELLASAMFNDWTMTPEWDNAETAASVGAITSTSIAVVNQSGSGGFSGASVKANHLVRLSGMGVAGNNGQFRITAATATSLTSTGLQAEPTPPATARVKVVGVEGGTTDIGALVDGLSSTALNFTTLGL